MKKTLLSTAALAVLSTPAFAEEASITPYVGIDLLRSSYSYNESYDDGAGNILNGESLLEDGLNSFNIHAGARLGDHFGAELGYFRSREGEKNIATGDSVGDGLVALTDFTTKTKFHGFSLDALGYLPVTDDKKFELIGTAGLTWTKATLDMTVPGVGSAGDDSSELGFRVGGGAQFSFTDSVSVRGMARYQTADFDDVAEHAWTYSLGANYSF